MQVLFSLNFNPSDGIFMFQMDYAPPRHQLVLVAVHV